MDRAVVSLLWTAEATAKCHRLRMQRSTEMRQDLQEQVAVELGQRTADDRIDVEKLGRVGAGLDDDVVRLLHDEQHAMRLNGACQMDLFTLANRKRRLPERGRRKRDGSQQTPLCRFLVA